MLLSCEDVIFEDNISTTNPFENFEYLWQKCDEYYSYFELKNVDWETVKQDYEPKLYTGMSQDSLFNVLSSMLNELKDDHVNLVSDFRTSYYGQSYSVPDSFDWRVIVDHYFAEPFEITGPFQHEVLVGKNIAYVRLSNFESAFSETQLDYIITKYQHTSGIILDLRENGGGKIANAYQLLERFINEETVVAYSQIKTGTEHDDFSEPDPVILKPYGGLRYNKPVVVLIDAGTFSSGSIFALSTKAFPHIKLIGQKTSGGLGMPKGGQMPNGWTYRFSVTQTLDLYKNNESENGVLPDIEVNFDWNDMNKDEILEEAIFQLQ